MRPPFFLTFLFWKRRKHNPVLCENMRSNFTKKEQVPILRFCVPKILVFFWRASSCAGLFPAFSTLLPLSFFWMCPFVRFAVFFFGKKNVGEDRLVWWPLPGEYGSVIWYLLSLVRARKRVSALGSSRVSDPWCYRHRPWCIVSVIKETLICCLWRRCITADLRCHVLPFAFKSSLRLMYTNVVLQIRFSLSLTDFIYLLYNVAFFCDIFLCSPY